MDTKQQRLLNAHRLNAIDDMKAHIAKLASRRRKLPVSETTARARAQEDINDIRQILRLIETDKREEARERYDILDTFVRECIPETFDTWAFYR